MQRSYLKWAGGKYNALPSILPTLERLKSDVLVEPFFGSGTVSLNFESQRYLVSDLNGDLVCTHNAVINNYDSLIIEVEELFRRGMAEYTSIRDEFNSLPKDGTDDIPRAARFIYLNKHGFNGLCRYNKKGGFNVPSAEKNKKPSVPYKEIRAFSDTGIDVNQLTFQEMFERAEAIDNCLIYCDPPYVPMGESNFNYTSGGFDFTQQESLKLMALNSRHTVVISNHYNSITEELYSDADELITFDVRRTISSKSTGRIPVIECLAIYSRHGGYHG